MNSSNLFAVAVVCFFLINYSLVLNGFTRKRDCPNGLCKMPHEISTFFFYFGLKRGMDAFFPEHRVLHNFMPPMQSWNEGEKILVMMQGQEMKESIAMTHDHIRIKVVEKKESLKEKIGSLLSSISRSRRTNNQRGELAHRLFQSLSPISCLPKVVPCDLKSTRVLVNFIKVNFAASLGELYSTGTRDVNETTLSRLSLTQYSNLVQLYSKRNGMQIHLNEESSSFSSLPLITNSKLDNNEKDNNMQESPDNTFTSDQILSYFTAVKNIFLCFRPVFYIPLTISIVMWGFVLMALYYPLLFEMPSFGPGRH